MTTIVNDTFTESGTGTASLTTHTAETGGTWSTLVGTNWLIDKDNDQATITTTSSDQVDYLSSTSLADGYGVTNQSAYNYTGMAFRIINSSNFYVIRATNDSEMGGQVIQLYRVTGGSYTSISSTVHSISDLSPLGVKFNVSGSSSTALKAKVWESGFSEPGTWNIETTDNTAGNQTSSGPVGIYGNRSISSGSSAIYDLSVESSAAGATTYSKSAQAQARIKTTYWGAGQSQADIKTTYYGYGQARTQVQKIGQGFAQARAYLRAYGVNGFGQSQAQISRAATSYSNSAQAAGYIAGTHTYAQDTFTRTESSAWGTADTGGTWVLLGTNTNFNVTGTEASFAPYDTNTRLQALELVDIKGSVASHLTYRLSALPVTAIYITAYSHLPSVRATTSSSSYFSGFGGRATISDTGAISISVASGGGANGTATGLTYTVGETWHLSAVSIPSGSTMKVYAKTWKDGTAEPAWQYNYTYNITSPGGHVGIAFATNDSSPTYTVYIDNFIVDNYHASQYAQAQAQIKTTTTNSAQAQARIKVFGIEGFGQAQADIKKAYAGFGQARTLIQKIGQGFGQAQAHLRAYGVDGFGQARAYIQGAVPYLRQGQAAAYITANYVWAQADFSGGSNPTGWLTSTGGTWNYSDINKFSQTTSEGVVTANVVSGYFDVTVEKPQVDIKDEPLVMSIKFKLNALPSSGTTHLGLFAYINSSYLYDYINLVSNSTYFAGALVEIWNDGNAYQAHFIRNSSFNTPSQSAISYSAGTYYWFKTRVRKIIDRFEIQSKLWADGEIEPGDWQVESTDTDILHTPNVGGHIGIAFNFYDISQIFTVDNYLVVTTAEDPTVLSTFKLAQSQAYILRVERAFAQSRATIKQTVPNFGQARAIIKNTYVGVAQSQAQILSTTTRSVSAQSQARIKTTYWAYGQAQARIKTTYSGFGQARAHVEQTYAGFAQARAHIEVVIGCYGQAQAQIKTTYWAYAQARAKVVTVVAKSAQSLALIGVTTDLYTAIDEITPDDLDWITSKLPATSYSAKIKLDPVLYPSWKQDHILRYRSDTKGGTTFTLSLYQGVTLIATATQVAPSGFQTNEYRLTTSEMNAITNYSDLYIQISCTDRFYLSWVEFQVPSGSPNTSVFGQSQARIKQLYTVSAQADANIKGRSVVFAQAAASIEQSYLGFAQARAQIEQTYYGYGQARATIEQAYQGYAQAGASIEQTYNGYGQAVARIKGQPNAYGQAQASLLSAIYVRQIFAQAQAKLNATANGFGQAQAAIGQQYTAFAQAKASLKSAVFGYAQAQARIRATANVFAQAQAQIGSAAYQKYAQAQAKLIYRLIAHAQARAFIRFYGGFAQAEAKIKGRSVVHAQATAYIAGTFTYAADTFTRTTSNSLGTADTGGAWSLGEYSGTGLNTTGTEATIYHGGVEDFITLPKVDARGSVEAYVKFKLSRKPGSQGYISIGLGLYLPSMPYTLQWNLPPTLGKVFPLNIQPNGTYAHYYGYYISTTNEATVEANEYWWFKVRVEMTKSDSALYAKAWQDVDGEPTAWQVENVPLAFSAVGGHVGIWTHFDATTTLTIDNYNAYSVKPVRHAQAQAYIESATKTKQGQAQAYISKSVKHGQAKSSIKTTYRGHGQAVARVQNGYLAYVQVAQALATIAAPMQGYGQANAFIYGQWFKYAQAQARIGRVMAHAQANSTILRLGNTNAYGQALSKIKVTVRRYAQAQAHIKGFPVAVAQAEARVVYRGMQYAQAAAQIAPKFAFGQANAMINIRLKLAQAGAKIKSPYNYAFGQAGAEVGAGGSRSFWIRYGKYYLPGYAQKESNQNTIRIGAHEVPYKDGSLSEYIGLENKLQSFSFKVVGAGYTEIKNEIQRAGTILRSGRNNWTKLYINRYDRYYLGYPTLIRLDNTVQNTRTADYSVEFMMKPWALSESNYTVTGVTQLDTGARDFTTTGGWTPATLTLTGTNITVSGYTDSGEFTGFVSVSGAVTNLVINSEEYTATINGVNKNGLMYNLDYQVYISPERTYFAVTGASAASLTWKNRWYK